MTTTTTSTGKGRPSGILRIALMFTGPILWSVHLFVVYAAHASLCALDEAGDGWLNAARLVVLLASAVILLALFVVGLKPHWLLVASGSDRGSNAFAFFVTRLLAALSFVAVAWGGAAALILPVCSQLR